MPPKMTVKASWDIIRRLETGSSVLPSLSLLEHGLYLSTAPAHFGRPFREAPLTVGSSSASLIK